MPEYVYALHDFTPENPDEVPFKAGEKIEVIEKDDMYGDGWWQGRNQAGKTGLFPQTYTSSIPPTSPSAVTFPEPISTSSSHSGAPSESTVVASTPLQPLREEPESALDNGDNSTYGPTNGGGSLEPEGTVNEGDGEVMKATMTDVQKAIEQLGRTDRDGARSFSYASSHGDYTDRSESETELDKESEAEDDGNFYKDARQKLALRAQRENQQRLAREAAQAAAVSASIRPPIDVELSDESEAEDEDVTHHNKFARHSGDSHHRTSYSLHEGGMAAIIEGHLQPTSQDQSSVLIPQRQPSTESANQIVPSEDFIVPSPAASETDLPTATAMRTEFTESSLIPPPASVPATAPIPTTADAEEEPSLEGSYNDASSLGGSATVENGRVSSPSTSVFITPNTTPAATITIASPTPSTIKVAEPFPLFATTALPSPTTSSAGSVGYSSTGIQQTITPATTTPSIKTGLETLTSSREMSSPQSPNGHRKPGGHPSEWTVDEVVEWLRSKGFDQGVCDKFIEQEIAGDVLLELDANILKSEIGIAAFGKRVHIMNAITELRRPPSVSSSDHQVLQVMTPRSQANSLSYSHSHTASMQSSAQQSFNNSPLAYGSQGFGSSALSPPLSAVAGFSPTSTNLGSIISPESAPHTGDIQSSPMPFRSGWRASDPGSISGIAEADETPVRPLVGLGLGSPPASPSFNGKTKTRPAQLVLSPSDGALSARAVAVDGQSPNELEEEKAVMSEGEPGQLLPDAKSKRRRLFGRSTESGSFKEKAGSIKDSASFHSKDASTPTSPPPSASPSDLKEPSLEGAGAVRRPSKGRRSTDERKAADRLSLFGSTFSGTLGKSRKPPPRLGGEERHISNTFSRIRDKKSSGRPSTADSSPPKEKPKVTEFPAVKEVKEKETKTKETRDPALLRKRTASSAEAPKRSSIAGSHDVVGSSLKSGPSLKSGQSILEQIGTPDHNGWMRKKGERYNAWKLRYFVLKGPHLYYMRNDSKDETKIKGYIHIVGYRVVADENVDPGRYGFRIIHDTEKPHYFSSDEQSVIREWMKALMKATISRDYTNPVVSSCNIPTIPLTVAQAMNPAPRPPSPSQREATQKALRRENPNQLSSRDAQVLLMGLPAKDKNTNGQNGERARLESFFTNDTISTNDTESTVVNSQSPRAAAPPRPSREMRRLDSSQSDIQPPVDPYLLEWANSHLPRALHISDAPGQLCGGLELLRLAEDIKGKPSSPPVPDSAFPSGPNDDKLDGLFRLFDFLLDNDVKMGAVSINDIRQGRRDKIIQLLRALKAWEDKRKAIATSIGKKSVSAGPFVALAAA